MCFVAGTLILTAAGLRAIESIRAGDRVLATDPESGVTEEKVVVETYVRETGRLVHLRVGGELISTTPNHPFWVRGRGFFSAGELQAGEELLTAAGEGCRIENVRQEIVESPERVYNFQVEGFHSYHVGSIGVLVHNADYGGEGGTSTLAKYGDDFGKMGTYVENPNIKVDWTQYAEHAAERMQQRGMTQEMVNNIVESGKVLSQNNGNKFAYITQEGVAIVSKEGKLITAWSSADFDSSMLEIINKLFGE